LTNKEISQQLNEIGEMLEVLNENSFKITAYQRAARMIDINSVSIEDIYAKDGLKGLENIKGVGQSIAQKIEELIKTGKIKYYYQLQKKVPEPIINFTQIPGVGP
jgi:DNA polymerase (family 10)